MFSKLGGATIFSTIDLCSGYYHIGLTRESRAQVSICRANGKMAVQTYTVWTQSSPSLFPVANQQGADGLQQFCDGIPGRYYHLQ